MKTPGLRRVYLKSNGEMTGAYKGINERFSLAFVSEVEINQTFKSAVLSFKVDIIFLLF